MCRMDEYLGSPYLLVHDAGKNFMDRAFQTNTDMLHIVLNPYQLSPQIACPSLNVTTTQTDGHTTIFEKSAHEWTRKSTLKWLLKQSTTP